MRIAAIRRNGFGDLLCAMPLCTKLKELYPNSELTVFVEERNAALAPYLSHYFDHYDVLPHNKTLSLLHAVRRRAKGWDLAISCKTSPMKYMNYLLWSLGAKQRIAYCEKHWSSRLINQPLVFSKKEQKGTHQSVLTLQLIDPAVRELPEHLRPTARLPEAVIAKHDTSIRQALEFGSKSIPSVLISVSNNRPGSSTLSPARWAQIFNTTAERQPLRVVLSCVPKDAERAADIGKHLHVPYAVIPTESFDRFMVLLSKMDACLVGDGGTVHLAAALNVPQVALFGKTCPVQWAPMSALATCLSDPLAIDRLSDEAIIDALVQTLRKK